MNIEKKILNLSEAAISSGTSEDTIKVLIACGDIQAFGPKKDIIRLCDLNKFLYGSSSKSSMDASDTTEVQSQPQIKKARKGNIKVYDDIMGSAYQLKSGKWQVAVSLGTDEKGKRIRPRGTGDTKEEALKALQAKLVKMKVYVPKEPAKKVYSKDITVKEFADDYFHKVYDPKANTRTLRDYLYSMQLFTDEYGAKCVKDISTDELLNFYRRMVNKKDKAGEYVYSQVTVDKVKRITRILFKCAVENKIIERSPYDSSYLRIPKSQKYTKSVKAYTEEEILQIIELSEEDIQLHTMIMLSLYTGMRAEEVLALRWNDIDEKHLKITVDEAQTTHYGDLYKFTHRLIFATL